MQFSEFGLDNRILRAIEHLGFTETTEIQQEAIPTAMTGRDLIASSKTGSGKTLAYLIPLMQRLLRVKALSRRDPRAVVLTPTRELAKQVYAQLRLLLSVSQGRGLLLCGGENFNDQIKQLRRQPQVIVATPGRLADHLLQRNLYLEGLELLVFDEADRMLDLGFSAQLRMIDNAANHRKRQTLMFSATLDDLPINTIAQELLHEPERIAIGEGFVPNSDIAQQFYLADHLDHKQALLKALLDKHQQGQVIVFTATRQDTTRLAELISQWGYSAQALSGELVQSKRNQIMDGFERGHQQVLVTTDLASRGLDIANVGLVVNFDLPRHAEEYVHRIGRTGRAGRTGLACSLVGPKDWSQYLLLRSFLHIQVEFATLDGLEGKFKGVVPKMNRLNRQTNRPQSPAKASPVARPKRVNTQKRSRVYHDGIDVGDQPLMRQSRVKNTDIDNDNDEQE
ncbi:DEAD/DEAH box helicase [Celerinatantimonas yamalensis]|uniref:DEAD/DEAH box helicase n=1 Tax=Celerinatantimonas yamalensis TaxID=559956 RepID=A0ABW9G5P7_9GAMM